MYFLLSQPAGTKEGSVKWATADPEQLSSKKRAENKLIRDEYYGSISLKTSSYFAEFLNLYHAMNREYHTPLSTQEKY